MKNQDIRSKAKAKGVKLWEIADKLGMIDSNFSKMLRKELPKKEKEKIFIIIDNIADKNNSAAAE